MSKHAAPMPLSEWRGGATMFSSFYDVFPADEVEDMPFTVLVHFVAPATGPAIGADKDSLPFIVPCLLKEAPLTAKTSAKTGWTVGKQRSSAHVTEAAFLVLDVDGLEQKQFDALLAQLRDAGLTFLCYSTHSHGRDDKPGIRARLAIPVDRTMGGEEYAQAWLGFDQIFCRGAIAAADASGQNLCQQQGVWSAHPERVGKAFRLIHKAGVAAADVLIAEGEKVRKKPNTAPRQFTRTELPAEVVVKRLESAVRFIDPDVYSTWLTTIMALKALAPMVGESAARELALRYSERGANTGRNNDSRYDPAQVFENAAPTMPPDVAIATIYARARDGSKAAVEQGLTRGALTAHEEAALAYLAAYHRTTTKELLASYGQGV